MTVVDVLLVRSFSSVGPFALDIAELPVSSRNFHWKTVEGRMGHEYRQFVLRSANDGRKQTPTLKTLRRPLPPPTATTKILTTISIPLSYSDLLRQQKQLESR